MAATTAPYRRRSRADTTAARLWASAQAHGPLVGAALARAGQRLRRLVLSVAAMVCIVTAAWMIAVPLGLVVAGGSLLWLEWLTTPEQPERASSS